MRIIRWLDRNLGSGADGGRNDSAYLCYGRPGGGAKVSGGIYRLVRGAGAVSVCLDGIPQHQLYHSRQKYHTPGNLQLHAAPARCGSQRPSVRFMLVVFTYLCYQSLSIISDTNQRWSSVNLSMNYVYSAIPVGFLLTVLRLAQSIVNT